MWFSLIIIHFFLGVASFFNGENINLGDVLSVKIYLGEVCPCFYRPWGNVLLKVYFLKMIIGPL